MRHHFFLHYEWSLQNLGKEAVRTNMHTTVDTIQKKTFKCCTQSQIKLFVPLLFASFLPPFFENKFIKINKSGVSPTFVETFKLWEHFLTKKTREDVQAVQKMSTLKSTLIGQKISTQGVQVVKTLSSQLKNAPYGFQII